MSVVSQGVRGRAGLRTEVSGLRTQGRNVLCTTYSGNSLMFSNPAGECRLPDPGVAGLQASPTLASLMPFSSERKALELDHLRFQSQLCHLLAV